MTDKKNSSINRLFEFAGNYKSLIVLSCILSGLSSIISIAPFICIWFVIRDVLKALPNVSQATQLGKYGWMAVAFALISITLYFIALICSHLAGFRVEKNMRKQAMHKIVKLPLGYFDSNTSGKLRKVIDDNASLTHGFIAHQLADFSGAIIMPIAILVVLFIFDWRLGLVCIIPLFFSMFFLKNMMGEENAKFMQKYMDALEEMNTAAVEYVRGIPVVKVFQQTVYSFKNFHKSITKYSDFASNYALSCRIPMVNFTMTINSPSLLLIPIGVLFILHAGNYKAFLLDLIFYMLFAPLCVTMMNKIMYSGESIMEAKEAISRIDEVINAKNLAEGNLDKKVQDNSICFENVTFTYPGNEKPAVSNVSFTVPKVKTYALVGSSGGGKTTVASLVPRFWDVNEGSVKVGEVDVRDFKEKDLMDKIAFVFQNTKLFKASLLDNICAARPNASKAEALRAANLAQCDDILEKMPEGIDTLVGSKGVYLSGGEQQRIALARAILKDAPIVILDEATAFADPENEYQIQRAFKSLTKGKTVLMIAHRLSSIKDVDCILVMQEGKIVERGTHEELLKQKGVYNKMWQEYQTSISWKVGGEAKNA